MGEQESLYSKLITAQIVCSLVVVIFSLFDTGVSFKTMN